MPGDPDKEAIVNGWLSAAAYEVRLGPYDARLAKLFPWLCINANTVGQRSDIALTLFDLRRSGRDWIALDHPTVADVEDGVLTHGMRARQFLLGELSLEVVTAPRAGEVTIQGEGKPGEPSSSRAGPQDRIEERRGRKSLCRPDANCATRTAEAPSSRVVRRSSMARCTSAASRSG